MAKSKVDIETAWITATILESKGSLVPGQAAFDAGTLRRLAEILHDLQLSEQQSRELIGAAQIAVMELWTDKGSKARDAITKLEAIDKASRQLIAVWRDLGSDLEESLADHFAGNSPTSAQNNHSSAEIQRRMAKAARVALVLKDDLDELAEGAGELAKALKKNSAHEPASYKCVMDIADAWSRHTGQLPTLTRNKDAVSGEQSSGFQRFIAEAADGLGIGDGVIRHVIEQLAIGEKSAPKV